LTSCTSENTPGFGWINHKLIQSGKNQPHINAFGGEDRIWLGPEAGQYSIFFKPGDKFDQNSWQTPECIDKQPFDLEEYDEQSALLTKRCKVMNYKNQKFDIEISRRISIISNSELTNSLKNIDASKIQCVAFKSENALENKAQLPWKRNTGLLNIWILGLFKPGTNRWVIIPTLPGAVMNQNYFKADLRNRLIERSEFSLLRVDGKHKAKIGLSPKSDKNVLGSFDFETNTLTVVQYETDKSQVFLNSEWNIQENPFEGDVLNVYNDGPDENGTLLGPYFELETSSSSRELKQGEHIKHTHTTKHFTGDFDELNKIARQLLDADLKKIKTTIDAG
jgi:hypothetical protein